VHQPQRAGEQLAFVRVELGVDKNGWPSRGDDSQSEKQRRMISRNFDC